MSLVAAAETRSDGCPLCGARLERAEGAQHCPVCSAELTVLHFEPVIEFAQLEPGAGRCATHPGQEAVEGCERCGGFLCSVCATRTGDRVLCPDCFDHLHGSGELETTRRNRFRPDFFAVLLAAAAPFVCVTLPFAPAVGIYGLVRRRRDPWINAWRCWAAILVAAPFVVFTLFLLLDSVSKG